MKVISIGRNPSCDIVLNSNMISRQHAVLKIYPFGKYEIISTGTNGTKVNGNPIAAHQPYPIKRGDSITFAQSANLDWNLVPNPLKPYIIGVIITGIVVVFLLIWLFIVPLFANKENETGGGERPGEIEQPKDTMSNEKGVEIEAEKPMVEFTFPNENKKRKHKEEKSDKKTNKDITSEKKKEVKAKDKEDGSSVALPRLR